MSCLRGRTCQVQTLAPPSCLVQIRTIRMVDTRSHHQEGQNMPLLLPPVHRNYTTYLNPLKTLCPCPNHLALHLQKSAVTRLPGFLSSTRPPMAMESDDP